MLLEACLKRSGEYQGTSIFEIDNRGSTAVYRAASFGNLTCVQAIGEEARRQDKVGKLVNKSTNIGRTPIYIASYYGNVEVVQYLIQNNATIDSATNEKDVAHGSTALIAACQEGKLEILRLLVNAGGDVRRQKQDGSDCVYMAARFNRIEVLQEVLPQHPSLVERRLFQGQTILHAASLNGNVEAVKYILEQGGMVTLNEKDDEIQGTPLMAAAYDKHLEVVKILLDAGAKVNEENKNGDTALTLAAYYGCLPCVKELARNNADIQHIGWQGNTALQLAEAQGHTKIVDYLKNL